MKTSGVLCQLQIASSKTAKPTPRVLPSSMARASSWPFVAAPKSRRAPCSGPETHSAATPEGAPPRRRRDAEEEGQPFPPPASGLVLLATQLGGRVIGLSGTDGSMIQAKIINERLGYVGEIVSVDASLIQILLEQDYIRVIAPLGQGPAG